MIEPLRPDVINPPAIVAIAQVFDEQALAREWREACADEHDAVTRKQIVLRKACARWPTVLRHGQMAHSPEMRRFVRDVLGMPDQQRGGMNGHALTLLREGARERSVAATNANGRRARVIKNAVVELVTKYRLGADGEECMAALAKFYEESLRG